MLMSYVILSSSSCQHDDNNNVTPSGTTTSTGNNTTTAPAGGWRLSLFSETGENKTSHFNGYTFDFAAGGTMTAKNGSQTVSGTWKQYQDNSITKFAISLNTTDKDMSELNDDWALVSRNDNFISLKDDNSSKNEVLQFSK